MTKNKDDFSKQLLPLKKLSILPPNNLWNRISKTLEKPTLFTQLFQIPPKQLAWATFTLFFIFSLGHLHYMDYKMQEDVRLYTTTLFSIEDQPDTLWFNGTNSTE